METQHIIFFFKAFHIFGFVSWFAALFYWVRMFIYLTEAREREEPAKSILVKEFSLMSGRVYKIIATPALGFTLIGGIGMLIANPVYLEQTWMHIKLTLVALLMGYHFYCLNIHNRLLRGEEPMTPMQLRMFNEVASVFLLAIAYLAVYRNTLNFIYALIGLFAFAMLLYGGIKLYKTIRDQGKEL